MRRRGGCGTCRCLVVVVAVVCIEEAMELGDVGGRVEVEEFFNRHNGL